MNCDTGALGKEFKNLKFIIKILLIIKKELMIL